MALALESFSSLDAGVDYPEATLLERGFSRRWLRRNVKALKFGRLRVYRGADILARGRVCQPPTPSPSIDAPDRHSGGLAGTSKEPTDVTGAGLPASTSPGENLSAWLRERLKHRPRSLPTTRHRHRQSQKQKPA